MSDWLTRDHAPLLYLTRYKSSFQCVSLRRRVCFNIYVAPCFCKVRFSLVIYRRNLVFSPLESSLEFVMHRRKPKFISLPVKFPAHRSQFQFCTTARSKLIIIFTRTVLSCLCFFLNPSTEITLRRFSIHF